MIIVGFNENNLSDNSQIIKDIQKYKIGGVILFQRNIKNSDELKQMVNKLQSVSSIPLFISIDHEGGKVARFKTENGFPITLSADELGTINNLYRTRQEGRRIGKLLNEHRINLNLAPVVDININPYNPIIANYGRSFSNKPDKVTKNAAAFIDGMAEYNVVSCLKHFPGHGNSKNDSHNGITDITKTWTEKELYPYKELIQNNKASMIMIGHLINNKLDSKYPATLSKAIITDLLRNKLKFNGIIISDDMFMGAITKYYSFKNSVFLGINAGIDLFIYSHNIYNGKNVVSNFIETVKKLLEEKKISYFDIFKSYNRIIKIKKQFIVKYNKRF